MLLVKDLGLARFSGSIRRPQTLWLLSLRATMINSQLIPLSEMVPLHTYALFLNSMALAVKATYDEHGHGSMDGHG